MQAGRLVSLTLLAPSSPRLRVHQPLVLLTSQTFLHHLRYGKLRMMCSGPVMSEVFGTDLLDQYQVFGLCSDGSLPLLTVAIAVLFQARK
jgi:hypothetical protein